MKNNDIDVLIEKFSQITLNDGNETYARAQFNLGLIYKYKKKDLNKAFKFFSNILESDSLQIYSKAQYQLADIYFFHKDDSNQARYYYHKIKYCSSASYIYVSARVISELIIAKDSNLISNKEDLKKSILANIKNICTSVDDIKDELFVSFNLKSSHDDNTEAKKKAGTTRCPLYQAGSLI
jgi:tetratricopeptide (TPR) repeat protein